MRDDKENIIVKLTFEFSLDIMTFAEELEEKKKYVFANQILKAGTSIGANVSEAQNAESKESKNYPFKQELLDKIQTIIKILSKIISSSKN